MKIGYKTPWAIGLVNWLSRKIMQNYWISCMAKIVIISNSMYQVWVKSEGPWGRTEAYGHCRWKRQFTISRVHHLILPQFVGPCIIARLMKVGAEICTKKMRNHKHQNWPAFIHELKSNTPKGQRLSDLTRLKAKGSANAWWSNSWWSNSWWSQIPGGARVLPRPMPSIATFHSKVREMKTS